MSDWLEDLGEFPATMVAQACQEWRRTQSRRPTPADIRSLCTIATNEARERAAAKALPRPDYDAHERAMEWRRAKYQEAEEARDKWAQEHGCKDFGEALQIGLAIVARRAGMSSPKGTD